MLSTKCPGTDARFIKVENTKCPLCDYELEIFSDEIKTRCPKCKTIVYRENIPSCIDWCVYAENCVGETVWKEIEEYKKTKNISSSLKTKLFNWLNNYFKDNKQQIDTIKTVVKLAELILTEEKGDPRIVIPAIVMLLVGLKPCKEDSFIEIYNFLNLDISSKEKICTILKNINVTNSITDLNHQIIMDAISLNKLKQTYQPFVEADVNKIFFTKTGNILAIKLSHFLK